jgi:multiple sugar transport system permease protein
MRYKKLTPYLLVSPYLIYFMIFIAFPVAFSVYLTFQKWNIISPMQNIGLSNYSRLAHDSFFLKSLINTFIFLIIHIPLQISFALLIAVVLNQKIKFRGFFRASFFLPVIVSGVVVTILWQQLYGYDSGLFNRILTSLGIGKIGWLVNPGWAMPSIALMATWKNVGLYIILFLVGLQTVPEQFYEAARLEGANRWQQFWKITFPAINPTVFMVVIISTISGFSLFIEPYVMTGGGPLNSTLSAVLYIYKQAFTYYHMGYAATLGLFFALLILSVVIIQRKFIEKENT